MIVIETAKICEELLDVLVKYRIPMHALDGVLKHLEELAHERTPIQNVDLED